MNTVGSATAGGTNCTACPAGTFTTSAGTTNTNNCLCKAGYEGVNGAVCTGKRRGRESWDLLKNAALTNEGSVGVVLTACPIGFYKSAIGNGTCTPCGTNAYTASTGSSSSSQCLCLASYYGNAAVACLRKGLARILMGDPLEMQSSHSLLPCMWWAHEIGYGSVCSMPQQFLLPAHQSDGLHLPGWLHRKRQQQLHWCAAHHGLTQVWGHSNC